MYRNLCCSHLKTCYCGMPLARFPIFYGRCLSKQDGCLVENFAGERKFGFFAPIVLASFAPPILMKIFVQWLVLGQRMHHLRIEGLYYIAAFLCGVDLVDLLHGVLLKSNRICRYSRCTAPNKKQRLGSVAAEIPTGSSQTSFFRDTSRENHFYYAPC